MPSHSFPLRRYYSNTLGTGQSILELPSKFFPVHSSLVSRQDWPGAFRIVLSLPPLVIGIVIWKIRFSEFLAIRDVPLKVSKIFNVAHA